jgi:FtsP/CotA-like multicopper oxidase with cupredoxin domain
MSPRSRLPGTAVRGNAGTPPAARRMMWPVPQPVGRARLFPWEGGWKDTVLLNDGETVAVKIRFEPWQRGQRYLIHCHKLEHEDAGMMAAFTVV